MPLLIKVTSSPSGGPPCLGRTPVVGVDLRALIRLTRMNTGPSVSAAQRMAAAVSIGSAGTTIVMLSMARNQAMSSMEW